MASSSEPTGMPAEAGDAALVEAARHGDKDAFATLVLRHRPLLVALCRRMLGDAALAEDAAQEATLAVLAKLDRFRGESAFPTWASKFGVSAAAGLLRRREWAHVSLEALPDWGSSVATVAREVCDDPEAGARRREAWCLFREVVEEDLTAQQRTVLSLVFFHGLPPDEVAERLGISRGACYKAGHDMRRAVKRAIERRGWTGGELLAAFEAPAGRGAR